MTLAEIKSKLDTTGYPVAYRFFEQSQMPAPPYVVYYEESEVYLYANNENYFSIKRIIIELIVKDKTQEAELKVETALAGVTYTKQEQYIDGEQATQITYEIEV